MRHLRRTFLAAVVAALSASSVAAVFAAPASATPPASFSATYSESSVTTSVRSAGGNTFVTVADIATFSGDLTGAATATERFLFRRDGSFVLHSRGTCLCSVADRTGTFEFRVQGGGTLENASGTVVGVGSDGLKGLHWKANWELVAPGVVALSGTYHFDG